MEQGNDDKYWNNRLAYSVRLYELVLPFFLGLDVDIRRLIVAWPSVLVRRHCRVPYPNRTAYASLDITRSREGIRPTLA